MGGRGLKAVVPLPQALGDERTSGQRRQLLEQ